MHQDMTITHVVVDGSNIATEGRDAPSLAQLDEAVQAFIEEFAPEHVTVVVDATFPNRIDRKERKTYEDAVNANELITPPAGAIGRGDAFILQIARRANAAILSNDSFQEFHGEFPWLFERGRLIGGKPVPHVGWVFMDRAPVRGPTSRRAVSEARKVEKVAKPSKVAKATEAAAERVAADVTGAGDEAPPPRRRRSRAKAPVDAVPVATPEETTGDGDRSDLALATVDDEQAEGAARARGGRSPEPYNEALPFIEFVGAHPVGSEVDATIERFSSHGAYVLVDSARAYVPLRNLADPAPRSAKEVVRLGEQRRFVVVAVDTPRRGIDLALPGVVPVPAAEPDDMAAVLAEMDADRIDAVVDTAGGAVDGDAGVAEAPPTRGRGRGRGRAAANAPAEKATRSAGAKKTAAKKAAANKAPARKAATAPAVDDAAHDVAPADMSETDAEAAARKTPAGRTSARKAAAQKAPARKAAATRAAGDEPPTEKPARTAAARKATAGQAPEKTAAKKTAAKKTSAKKTAAKKTTAKKTAAKKTTARKASARQAAADEPGADARVVPLVTDADAAPEAAEG